MTVETETARLVAPAPAPSWVLEVAKVADDYWPGPVPWCDKPTIEIVPAGYLDRYYPDGRDAAADPGPNAPGMPCVIWLEQDVLTRTAAGTTYLMVEVCNILVHEYGHLHLGEGAFAAENPADPSHSADPTNVMFGGERSTVPECEIWIDRANAALDRANRYLVRKVESQRKRCRRLRRLGRPRARHRACVRRLRAKQRRYIVLRAAVPR